MWFPLLNKDERCQKKTHATQQKDVPYSSMHFQKIFFFFTEMPFKKHYKFLREPFSEQVFFKCEEPYFHYKDRYCNVWLMLKVLLGATDAKKECTESCYD